MIEADSSHCCSLVDTVVAVGCGEQGEHASRARSPTTASRSRAGTISFRPADGKGRCLPREIVDGAYDVPEGRARQPHRCDSRHEESELRPQFRGKRAAGGLEATGRGEHRRRPYGRGGRLHPRRRRRQQQDRRDHQRRSDAGLSISRVRRERNSATPRLRDAVAGRHSSPQICSLQRMRWRLWCAPRIAHILGDLTMSRLLRR